MPSIPVITLAHMKELLPSAFTIAFLAGIESLLSAVVADGMTGFRHRSNAELLAQGVANIASAFFGGLPATGAIARTATNIRSNAKTPVSGMMHAVFLLAFMYFLAPLAKYVPLPSLAAILIIVAWGMSEMDRFAFLLRGPKGDRMVLLLTFLLTALVDLTVAIEVGMVWSAFAFMIRMARSADVHVGNDGEDVKRRTSDSKSDMRHKLPKDVELFVFNGPFFFGAVSSLSDVSDQILSHPRVYILEMSNVPMMDASGVSALTEFIEKCHKHHIKVVLAGLSGQPRTIIQKMRVEKMGKGTVSFADDYKEAIGKSEQLLAA
jgi:SulP family sulfate permease